jgi:hypothetical protein
MRSPEILEFEDDVLEGGRHVFFTGLKELVLPSDWIIPYLNSTGMLLAEGF